MKLYLEEGNPGNGNKYAYTCIELKDEDGGTFGLSWVGNRGKKMKLKVIREARVILKGFLEELDDLENLD